MKTKTHLRLKKKKNNNNKKKTTHKHVISLAHLCRFMPTYTAVHFTQHMWLLLNLSYWLPSLSQAPVSRAHIMINGGNLAHP